MTEQPKKFLLIPIALLVLGALPLPYGYYTFLRIIVTFAAVWLTFVQYDSAKTMTGWAWVFVCMAALFNPFVPVYLSKTVWVVFDLIAAGVIGLYMSRGELVKPKTVTASEPRDGAN